MLDTIIKELNNQFHVKGLKFEFETVDEFVFSTNFGHITVNKDTTETFSTACGFMGVLLIK